MESDRWDNPFAGSIEDQLCRRVDTCTEDIRDLREELEELIRKNKSLEDKMPRNKRWIRDLREELEEIKEEVQSLKQKNESLKDKMTRNKRSIQDLDLRLND